MSTGELQSDRWLDVRPGFLAGLEFAKTVTIDLLLGFGSYLWLSFTVGGPPTDEASGWILHIGWIHLAHESAYLWLTASSVLVLALAASSSLELDKAPLLGEEKLDKLLAEYDIARIGLARKLMRFGSTIGACFAIFVACAGARDYIREAIVEGTCDVVVGA